MLLLLPKCKHLFYFSNTNYVQHAYTSCVCNYYFSHKLSESKPNYTHSKFVSLGNTRAIRQSTVSGATQR